MSHTAKQTASITAKKHLVVPKDLSAMRDAWDQYTLPPLEVSLEKNLNISPSQISKMPTTSASSQLRPLENSPKPADSPTVIPRSPSDIEGDNHFREQEGLAGRDGLAIHHAVNAKYARGRDPPKRRSSTGCDTLPKGVEAEIERILKQGKGGYVVERKRRGSSFATSVPSQEVRDEEVPIVRMPSIGRTSSSGSKPSQEEIEHKYAHEEALKAAKKLAHPSPASAVRFGADDMIMGGSIPLVGAIELARAASDAGERAHRFRVD